MQGERTKIRSNSVMQHNCLINQENPYVVSLNAESITKLVLKVVNAIWPKA